MVFSEPRGVAVGDFDEDARSDLVVTQRHIKRSRLRLAAPANRRRPAVGRWRNPTPGDRRALGESYRRSNRSRRNRCAELDRWPSQTGGLGSPPIRTPWRHPRTIPTDRRAEPHRGVSNLDRGRARRRHSGRPSSRKLFPGNPLGRPGANWCNCPCWQRGCLQVRPWVRPKLLTLPAAITKVSVDSQGQLRTSR